MNIESPLSPQGEVVAKILCRLLEQSEMAGKTIERANRQYNLSLLEEGFLIRKFLKKEQSRIKP